MKTIQRKPSLNGTGRAAPAPSRPTNRTQPGVTTRSQADVCLRLRGVDWNFPDSAESGTIHAIHPYPAKFISDIPRALIAAIGIPTGTAVFDPFCGAGTTLAVAQQYGAPSIGVDLNPIACLISRVKTQPLPSEFGEAARRIAAAVLRKRTFRVPDVPNLDHWFEEPVRRALSGLTDAIRQEVHDNLRDHLRAALSSIVVRVSNQESDTRYAAIKNSIAFETVITHFIAACDRIALAKKDAGNFAAEATVIESDILRVSPADIQFPVSLAITSPPYPNAYEYWLYHKYRMWWLGLDPIAVKRQEIGARAHYFKKNHATYDEFVAQMRSTMSLVSSVLVPYGYFAVVVGRSRIHGVDFDTAATFATLGSATGFQLVFRTSRTISRSRKSFNLSHARIADEDLLVFQRKG